MFHLHQAPSTADDDMRPAGGEVCVRYSMARCGYSPSEFTSWNPQQIDFRHCFLELFSERNGPVSGSSFFGYNVGTLPVDGWPTASYTASPKVAQAECLFVATLQDKDKEVGCDGTVEQHPTVSAENLRVWAIQHRGSGWPSIAIDENRWRRCFPNLMLEVHFHLPTTTFTPNMGPRNEWSHHIPPRSRVASDIDLRNISKRIAWSKMYPILGEAARGCFPHKARPWGRQWHFGLAGSMSQHHLIFQGPRGLIHDTSWPRYGMIGIPPMRPAAGGLHTQQIVVVLSCG